MTEWGSKLQEESIRGLQKRLAETDDDGKAVKRLFTAIAYKQGQSPADIEATYGIPRKTVYQWLDRIDRRGVDDAIYDDPKPGRPARLDDEQRRELANALERSPEEFDYDRTEWTPRLVQDWVRTRFDVDYSSRHVRRLMADLERA